MKFHYIISNKWYENSYHFIRAFVQASLLPGDHKEPSYKNFKN